mmetsp:Transcript_5255/g.12035  ORF Transcript_5255/g.12035 Transcript_5255/m.12035 type:complete len:273 (-) Transcript_5255:40-858(-)
MPEDDGIAHLHHRRLHVQREEEVVTPRLGVSHLRVEEGGESLLGHARAVGDVAGVELNTLVLEDGHLARRRVVVLDASVRLLRGCYALLGVVEVSVGHGRDVRLAVFGPRTHGVRVRARVLLDSLRRTSVAVSLAQHGVDRRSLRPVVLSLDGLLLGRLGCLGVVGDGEPSSLQLLDRRLDLWHGCGDVRRLDDDGIRLGGKLAELGECVVHLLVARLRVRKLARKTRGERDVARVHLDADGSGERLDDRQERVRREHGRFVAERVNDFRLF